MTRTNSTIRIRCKCSPDCNKVPTIGYRGYNILCVPEELKAELTKNKVSKRLQTNTATLARKLYKAQQKGNNRIFSLKTPQKTPIAKASKKRLAELKIYNLLRKDFLLDHPKCECGLPDCKKLKSYDVHHLYMGRDRGKYFLVVETWKAVSRICHKRIHIEFSTEQLVELGLRKIDY